MCLNEGMREAFLQAVLLSKVMLTPNSNCLQDKEETATRTNLSCQCVIDDIKGHVAQQYCNCHFLVSLASIQAPVWGYLGNLHTCAGRILGWNTWVSAVLSAVLSQSNVGHGWVWGTPYNKGIYHKKTYEFLSFREKWFDGRSPDCGSLAIIHRQANQASKSGTTGPPKCRVGIKAAQTGHCNPIEMLTLRLSKGNGCGEWEVRRKGWPLKIDIKLWKVRRGKKGEKNACDRLGLLNSSTEEAS